MFWTTPEFPVVVKALNEGFLVTLQLFFVTIIGAVPLGLVISFGSMSRWAPLRRPVRWALARGDPGHPADSPDHRPLLCPRHAGPVHLGRR